MWLSGAGKVVDGALGIETTGARPDESDGTTVLRIWSWFQGKAEALPRPSGMAYKKPENGKNKLLGTIPVTRKDASILAKIDT